MSKAYRLAYHSTLGWRVVKKKQTLHFVPRANSLALGQPCVELFQGSRAVVGHERVSNWGGVSTGLHFLLSKWPIRGTHNITERQKDTVPLTQPRCVRSRRSLSSELSLSRWCGERG